MGVNTIYSNFSLSRASFHCIKGLYFNYKGILLTCIALRQHCETKETVGVQLVDLSAVEDSVKDIQKLVIQTPFRSPLTLI